MKERLLTRSFVLAMAVHLKNPSPTFVHKPNGFDAMLVAGVFFLSNFQTRHT